MLLNLDSNSVGSQKHSMLAHLLATMEQLSPKSTLMYDQYFQIWGGSHWSVTDENRGHNCGILCTNLWKNWTDFWSLYWEVEGISNSKKAQQQTQTVFCMHSIIHNSVKQELEGGLRYYTWTSDMGTHTHHGAEFLQIYGWVIEYHIAYSQVLF